MRNNVHVSYVICTTVRSGSWMLCSALIKTGIAGRPSEYFGQTLWEELMNNRTLLKLDSAEGFMDRVVEASTTQNGVFGMKLPANHTGVFLRRAYEHAGAQYTSLRTALESEFPNLRYIWLTRKDKAAQAVSLYKAVMSGHWRNADTPTARARLAELQYDRFGVERCYQDIIASDVYWEGFFKTQDISPIPVSYESLTGEYEPTIRALLHSLGLPWHGDISEAGTTRLADERSREWTEKFRSEGRLPAETAYRPESLWAPY